MAQPAWRYPAPSGWAAAHYLAQGVRRLCRGRRWRRGRALLAHTVVAWSTEWRVWVFHLDRDARRRTRRWARVVRRVRRGLRLDAPPGVGRPRRWFGRVARTLVRSAPHSAHRWACDRAAALGVAVRLGWCPLRGRNFGSAVGADLRYRLRGRHQRRVKSVVFPLMARLRRTPGVVGAHIRCNGRFTRAQRASHQRYGWGRLGLADPSQRVVSTFATAALRFGSVGVTLVVNYG